MARGKQNRMSITFPDSADLTYTVFRHLVSDHARLAQKTESQFIVDSMSWGTLGIMPKTALAKSYAFGLYRNSIAFKECFSNFFEQFMDGGDVREGRPNGKKAVELLQSISMSLSLTCTGAGERGCSAKALLKTLYGYAMEKIALSGDESRRMILDFYSQFDTSPINSPEVYVSEICQFVLTFWPEFKDLGITYMLLSRVVLGSCGWGIQVEYGTTIRDEYDFVSSRVAFIDGVDEIVAEWDGAGERSDCLGA